MTEELATTAPNAMDILSGSAYEGDSGYIAAPNYFSLVWKKSGDQAQDAAKAAGITVGKNVLFASTRAGLFNFLQPFQFYLLASEEVFNKTDRQGKSLAYSTKKLGDDYREGFIALMVAQQGSTLVPMVSTVGRLQSGASKAIKTARIAVQSYKLSSEDLAARGEQFRVASTVKALPFRTLITMTGEVKSNDNGEFPVTNASNRPVTQADLDILEYADPTNPESPFSKDLAKCLEVYQDQLNKARKGWTASE